MDRVLREERAYILEIVKQIKKAGCNVLLIQKSILRDALSDLAIHFFDKMKVSIVCSNRFNSNEFHYFFLFNLDVMITLDNGYQRY